LKKGSAELLILTLVETRARHGYEISKLIDARSDGVLRFNVAALYPLLYRLENEAGSRAAGSRRLVSVAGAFTVLRLRVRECWRRSVIPGKSSSRQSIA